MLAPNPLKRISSSSPKTHGQEIFQLPFPICQTLSEKRSKSRWDGPRFAQSSSSWDIHFRYLAVKTKFMRRTRNFRKVITRSDERQRLAFAFRSSVNGKLTGFSLVNSSSWYLTDDNYWDRSVVWLINELLWRSSDSSSDSSPDCKLVESDYYAHEMSKISELFLGSDSSWSSSRMHRSRLSVVRSACMVLPYLFISYLAHLALVDWAALTICRLTYNTSPQIRIRNPYIKQLQSLHFDSSCCHKTAHIPTHPSHPVLLGIGHEESTRSSTSSGRP